MTHTEAQARTDEVLSIDQRVAGAVAGWKAEARALGNLATAFGPLTRASGYQDLTKLPGLLERLEGKIRALGVGDRGLDVVQDVRKDMQERMRHMQEHLAKDLRAACEEHGLGLRVVRREEPIEVRIPPFAVLIDREKGRAELCFGRQSIATCAADASAIVGAHREAFASMSKGFHPERFFDACLSAWRAAVGAGCGGAGERVEILDFLPYLALQLQSSAFRVEPTERNFKGYSRARFAFDVMSLRKGAMLSRDGMRLNLGVATGTTASKKNRTLFFEDENGSGEFKLTVFFTRAETI